MCLCNSCLWVPDVVYSFAVFYPCRSHLREKRNTSWFERKWARRMAVWTMSSVVFGPQHVTFLLDSMLWLNPTLCRVKEIKCDRSDLDSTQRHKVRTAVTHTSVFLKVGDVRLCFLCHCFHRSTSLPVLPVLHGRQQLEWGDESVWFLHRCPKLFLQLPKPRRTKTNRGEKS